MWLRSSLYEIDIREEWLPYDVLEAEDDETGFLIDEVDSFDIICL